MVSSNTAMCISPRPNTVKPSAMRFSFGVKSTLSPTFTSSSRSRRSRIWRLVTNFPSFPAKGELLTRKSKTIVGSSIVIAGKSSTSFSLLMVSPIKMSAIPASMTMSPACASFTSSRVNPWKVKSFVIFAVRASPPRVRTNTLSPIFATPSYTRPTAKRPRKLSYARLNACMRNGLVVSFCATGTFSRIVSNKGVRSLRSSSGLIIATPSRPIAYTVVKSSCSSFAPSSIKSSNTPS